jgi:hypothetical protein
MVPLYRNAREAIIVYRGIYKKMTILEFSLAGKRMI